MDAGTDNTRRRAFLYAREPGASTQLAALRNVAAQREFDIQNEFVDVLPLGARGKCPGRDGLLASVRRGEIGGGVVLCTSLALLGHNLRELVSILDELRARGVGLVVPHAVDTIASPNLNAFIAALGRVEADTRGARIRAGLTEARRRGTRVGRPPANVPVDDARQLMATGMSLRGAARALRIAPSTLHRALRFTPSQEAAA